MIDQGKKYLVIKGIAGMGNRLLAAIEGILYSRITNRKLIIDWSDQNYSDGGTNVFPRLFESPRIFPVSEVFNASSVFPSVWGKNMSKFAEQIIEERGWGYTNNSLSKLSIDIKRKDYSEDVLVRCSFFGEIHKLRKYFTGEFEEYKYLKNEDVLGKIYRENFVLLNDIRQKIDYFKQNNFDNKTIGVHVRNWDYTYVFSRDPCKYAKKCEKIINRILGENMTGKIFLSTDSRKIDLFFKKKYGEDRILTTEKWLPEDDTPLHINRECPDKYQNAVAALTDMYLLAECKYVICNLNSTFSFLAKLISSEDRTKFIDTERFNITRILRRAKRHF